MSVNSHLLGIDIGTESTKGVLFDTEGKVVGEFQKGYPLKCPKPGWAEQDPEIWWRATTESVGKIIKKLNVSPDSILGVGVCGQMHAPIPIDKKGNLLYHSPLLWCDKRNVPQSKKLKDNLEEEHLMEITGNPITPAWTAIKLLWMKENTPKIYSDAYKFLLPKDFISYKLTGELSTDYSDASGTFLFDINKEKWSEELAEEFQIDIAKLPKIVPSHKVIGEVTSEVAKITGLSQGTPVISGGADFMCTLLSGGIVSEERAADISGTASEVAFYSQEPLIDKRIMNIHHVIEGWVPFGIQEGGLLRWFRDEFGYEEIQTARKKGVSPYQIMVNEAAKVEMGSEGLILTPYFMGKRPGSLHAKGGLFGLTTAHGKAHIIRAIMEGIAYSMKETIDLVEELGIKVDAFRALGGGAKNLLWRKIKADIYGKPILSLNTYEGGALGVAILAGVGVNVFDDPVSVADDIVSIGERCEPTLENHKTYEKLYKKYKKVNEFIESIED